MDTASIVILVIALLILVCVSGFFSGSETGLMSINRYRLRHQMREGKKSAARVSKLLERPDRLLGIILIGNTFANVMASSVATILFIKLLGDYGVAVATILVTFILLIFAEIAPKTVAALYSQKIAYFASLPLTFLLKILYPVVWVANGIVNNLLKMFGIVVDKTGVDHLSVEELRTVVLESSSRISPQHQDMLLRILEMEAITVDDIMVPRNEIVGIDLNAEWDEILEQLTHSPHTKIPLYKDDIDNVVGIIHLREALNLLGHNKLSKMSLEKIAREIYYIPEGTPLHIQLFNFRKEQRRQALVVDEYGDIMGLVTIEDILEEIVGELTTEVPSIWKSIKSLPDGSYEVDGGVSIREINRILEWQLPVDGPKTLGGLIVEHFEEIPETGICMRIEGYPLEVLSVEENLVKLVKIMPQLKPKENM